MAGDKNILVVPAADVNLKFLNGFYSGSDNKEILEGLLSKSCFMMRDEAETNESFKQFIPYCVVKTGQKIFIYQRNNKGGEKRLTGFRSLGIGGHIKYEDGKDNHQCYFRGLARELKEELGLEKHHVMDEIGGFIYDNSNLVGRVHIGIIHILTLWNPNQELHIEDTMDNWSFETNDILEKSTSDFENWSQIIINQKILE